MGSFYWILLRWNSSLSSRYDGPVVDTSHADLHDNDLFLQKENSLLVVLHLLLSRVSVRYKKRNSVIDGILNQEVGLKVQNGGTESHSLISVFLGRISCKGQGHTEQELKRTPIQR